MRRNEQALADIELMPKVLAGAPKRDQSIELFGDRLPSPVVIGPTGLAGLLWPHAELAAARAAARFGTIYSTSHASTATIEEIGAATAGPKWMQVFLYKDRGLTAEFAARAAAAGYKALILTVDNQVVAGRDRDMRNGMSFPLRWGPQQLPRLRQPTGLDLAHARDAFADLRQLREADVARGLWPADGRAARPGRRLGRRRAAARAVARAARDQGPPASGRGAGGAPARGRRSRRLQSRRPAARRRRRLDHGAAGHCRRGRRYAARSRRRRLPPRDRRDQGSGARGARAC